MAIIIYCGIYILTTVLAISPRAISGRFFFLSWFVILTKGMSIPPFDFPIEENFMNWKGLVSATSLICLK
jgi:hypothetical protein